MASKQQKYARKRVQRWAFAHSSPLTQQIAAVLSSFGYDQFDQLQRCKLLKTKSFPASLRLVSEQIDSYHIDPVYESMT
jgi:uncharacterized protein with PIN domain